MEKTLKMLRTICCHSPIAVFFDEAEKLLRKDPPKPRKTYPDNKWFRIMGLSPR